MTPHELTVRICGTMLNLVAEAHKGQQETVQFPTALALAFRRVLLQAAEGARKAELEIERLNQVLESRETQDTRGLEQLTEGMNLIAVHEVPEELKEAMRWMGFQQVYAYTLPECPEDEDGNT